MTKNNDNFSIDDMNAFQVIHDLAGYAVDGFSMDDGAEYAAEVDGRDAIVVTVTVDGKSKKFRLEAEEVYVELPEGR